jgi:molybdenum cofactor biosynthesis protein B
MADRDFVPLSIGVLTISDTRSEANDKSGRLIADSLAQAGHAIVVRSIVADDIDAIRDAFAAWQHEQGLDVVITTGGTGLTRRDVTREALEPFISKEIPGFGELFRWLSYSDIGAATIQSRVFGALCTSLLLFALPGSTGAVELGLHKILLPQLDSRTMPCNFASLLPRIRREG